MRSIQLNKLLILIREGHNKALGRTKLHQLREAVLKMNLSTSVGEGLAMLRNWRDDQRDYVFDCKGETIFRQRCIWPVFETITDSAIERGILVDDTPEKCTETHTCVAATPLLKRLQRETRRFVKRNYLPVADNLRIAGRELKPSATDPRKCDFEVTIPASYEIISPNQGVSGTLDGVPYTGARFLAAGPHVFESASTSRNLTLLWAQAADRHFTPRGHHTFHHS